MGGVMKHWSKTRKLSFAVHALFVTVPFLASTVSAFVLWRDLFGSGWYAVPMVAVIDVLSLTGLILYIARVPSPFVPLRHALPFVSVVPLGRELYLLLEQNGWLVATCVTAIVIALFTWIAWQCFTTIERLFVPPVVAAREKTREQLEALSISLAQLGETSDVVREFMTVWQGQRLTRVSPHTVTSTITSTVSAPVPVLPDENKTAKVKALAVEHNVSESTAWRKIRAGEWKVEE
jgi:hypothetical protein